jgi:hypothetical protein
VRTERVSVVCVVVSISRKKKVTPTHLRTHHSEDEAVITA